MAAYFADVGRRMREARERNRPDLSQEAAAHEIGVSVKQYGRWEQGKSQPRADKWAKIAKVLRVEPDSLRGQPPALPEDELRGELKQVQRALRATTAEIAALSTELSQAEARLTKRLQRIERKLGTGSTGTRSQTGG